MKKSTYANSICFLFVCLLFGLRAHAIGVFDMPHYISPGAGAVALEPQVVFGDGAGAGINAHYTRGLTTLTNVGVVLGTGGGDRNFRLGARGSFDFFPDAPEQPGLGLGTEALYLSFNEQARWEVTAIPYVHKSFVSGNVEFEPYVALPLGIAFMDGSDGLISLAVGSIFKKSETFSFLFELGIAINNTDTYISTGLIFSHQ